MGALLAKFRRNQDTTQLLENLQEQIESLEKYTFNTQEQKKRFVGTFLAVSVGVYAVAFAVFYFLYFPSTWTDRLLYSLPLFIFPVVIIMLRHLVTWYFERKLNKNSTKLSALRSEKKKIIEQVMDKETYKVAVNLLSRFGDKSSSVNRLPFVSPLNRSLNLVVPQSKTLQGALAPARPNASLTARAAFTSASNPSLNSDLSTVSTTLTPSSFSNQGLDQELRRRTPFPIVNPNNKSIFERIVDVLIGDGPQHRFAMICKHCYGHNGMALREEFEYMAFHCVYCNSLNPARKSRPIAPRLSGTSRSLAQEFHDNSSSDSPSSDDKDDSEDDREESNLDAKRFNPMDSDNNNDSNSEVNSSLASSRTNELEKRMQDIQEELKKQVRFRSRSQSETMANESPEKFEKLEVSD